MTIRFLQTARSSNPDFPFLAGQVITVAEPTAEMVAALNDGRAEAVKTDDVEFATVRAPRAARKRGRIKRSAA